MSRAFRARHRATILSSTLPHTTAEVATAAMAALRTCMKEHITALQHGQDDYNAAIQHTVQSISRLMVSQTQTALSARSLPTSRPMSRIRKGAIWCRQQLTLTDMSHLRASVTGRKAAVVHTGPNGAASHPDSNFIPATSAVRATCAIPIQHHHVMQSVRYATTPEI